MSDMQRSIDQANKFKRNTNKDYAVVELSTGHYQVWTVSRLCLDTKEIYRTDIEPIADKISWSAAMEQMKNKFVGGLV